MDFASDDLCPPRAKDFNTPPSMTQSAPVPAQAMHLRNPRRSIPSLLWSCWIRPPAFRPNSVDFDIGFSGSVRQNVLHRDKPRAREFYSLDDYFSEKALGWE